MLVAKVFTPLVFCCPTMWNLNEFYETNKKKKRENLSVRNYSPHPKSLLCRATFCSTYSCKSLRAWHISQMEFLPIPTAKPLQHLQVGRVLLVFSNLQIIPHILNWIEVWALTWPLQDIWLSLLEPLECCFSSVLRLIVLLGRWTSVPVTNLLKTQTGLCI